MSEDAQLLSGLNGEQESFLEITVSADGTLQIYEAYSEGRARDLARDLSRLGVRVEVIQSSPCG